LLVVLEVCVRATVAANGLDVPEFLTRKRFGALYRPGGDLGSYLHDALGQIALLGLGIPLAIAALMGAAGVSIRVVRRFRNPN
jgi:hypothetical protein